MTTRNFLDLQPRRPAIHLGQNRRRGQPAEIDDPSFLELTLGYTPPGRVNVQALNDDVIIIDSDSEMSADDEQGQLDTESQTSSTDSEDTSSTSTSVLCVAPVAPPSPPPPPPPPPPATLPQPTFTCPICLGPIVDETSTRCGHIFCYACIKSALSSREECPTCRFRITRRTLNRVYIPEPL